MLAQPENGAILFAHPSRVESVTWTRRPGQASARGPCRGHGLHSVSWCELSTYCLLGAAPTAGWAAPASVSTLTQWGRCPSSPDFTGEETGSDRGTLPRGTWKAQSLGLEAGLLTHTPHLNHSRCQDRDRASSSLSAWAPLVTSPPPSHSRAATVLGAELGVSRTPAVAATSTALALSACLPAL